MLETIADPLSPSCYHLFPGAELSNFNTLVLIPIASRAERAWRV